MKLNPEEVEKVAALAKLTLAADEKERFSHQLSSILSHMDVLNQVPTHEIDPSPSPVGGENVLRDDVVRPSLSQDDALRNAPEAHSGFFKVPKILNDR
ncbi:MAG: Asp-tRNA(Asn)/Glu-tRNA(Gln) amidotransferase subunit GatC [Nitrospirota bacterium]|nr:Asp-tRNA(Asn)/Glu-tRNA(Gln) amidotransferase subunit GatC [Nitrospirota bacterium]